MNDQSTGAAPAARPESRPLQIICFVVAFASLDASRAA
jgi:hypothetical protein